MNTQVVKEELRRWPEARVKLIERKENEEADALVGLGAMPCPIEGRWIQVETKISTSTVKEPF